MSPSLREQPSFVRCLMAGDVDLSDLQPYPALSHGRVPQIEGLLAEIRTDSGTGNGVDRLRSWGLLDRPPVWSPPLLARVIRQIGATDVSAALSAVSHLALGTRLISQFGSEAQMRELSHVQSALCAFALTEASPGSDVSRIQTWAEETETGFVLNGTKNWVTNGVSATHFIVLARTAPPRASDKPKLTAFLLPKGPGVDVTPVSSDVLPGAGVAEVSFNNVELEKNQVLGQLGKGFRVVMTGLSEARLLVSAAVLGACVRAYNDTVTRVSERRAFGRSVGKFPSVQTRIASMLADTLAMESLVHASAGRAGVGYVVDAVERGVVRLSVSRLSARVLDAARELHGAAAFAGNTSASRHWADTRALTLLDGSDLALESFVILEGTRDIGQRLARLGDNNELLTRVDAATSLMVDKAKSKIRRAQSKEIPGVEFAQLQGHAKALGVAVESALKRYGTEFVEKQHVHSRLASLTAELSAWTAVAARVSSECDNTGEVGAHRMIEAARVWCRAAERRVQDLFAAIESNDDGKRDAMAHQAYADKAYPFDIF